MKRKIVFLLFLMIFIIPYIARTIEAKETVSYKVDYINIRVNAGDTMLSISETYRGEVETQTFIRMIQQINNMNHTVIRENSYLKIPVF